MITFVGSNIGRMKTYTQTEEWNEEMNFSFYRMETLYELSNGEPDVPHRHDFYTILLVCKARGKHFIDFHEYELTDNQLFFVSPGQVHQMVEEVKPRGYCIMFSSQFLLDNQIPICFIDELRLFHDYGDSPPLALNQDVLERLVNYADEMEQAVQSNMKFKEQAVASLLNLLLIRCDNLCALSNENPQTIEAKNTLLKSFRKMVDERFADWHQIADYATALNVTPDHLNRVVKNIIGVTAKEYVQSRIIVEAKRLLYFSDQSAKEIGYLLGFSEPANFSAFFKNITGISPSNFKLKR